jgi:hypothetical protein
LRPANRRAPPTNPNVACRPRHEDPADIDEGVPYIASRARAREGRADLLRRAKAIIAR